MNRSRSLRVIVASLMTVLGILLTQFPNSALANPTPTPTSSASALTCKKYVFIGMRGSGEKFTPNGTVVVCLFCARESRTKQLSGCLKGHGGRIHAPTRIPWASWCL